MPDLAEQLHAIIVQRMAEQSLDDAALIDGAGLTEAEARLVLRHLSMATCDSCDCESAELGLCSLAGGGWDERYVKNDLRKWGWTVDGDKTLCGSCAQEFAEMRAKSAIEQREDMETGAGRCPPRE